jgi:hypothetical protein
LSLGRWEDLNRDLGSFGLDYLLLLVSRVARSLFPADIGQLLRGVGIFVAVAAAWAQRDIVPCR